MELLIERRVRHGIALSLYIEFARLDKAALWRKLEEALDLIAQHRPIWIKRMVQLQNSVNVRRIPATRAMLTDGRFTILDPYLLADFQPAQIASSIIHEAMHAKVRSLGRVYDPKAPAREERACRRAELRFGIALREARVPHAEAVIARAENSLRMRDKDVGVVVDWEELRVIRLVTRLNDYPVPMWWKRRIARRWRVLDTAHGRAAFGRREK
jgi:hypothetical protein